MVESYCSQVIGLRRITLQKRLRVFSCEFTPEHAQKPASVLPLTKLLCSIKSKFSAFFFYQGFFSRSLTIHMIARAERGRTFRHLFSILHPK